MEQEAEQEYKVLIEGYVFIKAKSPEEAEKKVWDIVESNFEREDLEQVTTSE